MGKEEFKIEPELKEQINKEGWEKLDEKSGAAVLIGKKEDMERLRERLETGGKTTDLGSYIRLHKESFLPSNEMRSGVREKVMARTGSYVITKMKTELSPSCFLEYVDKEGNITGVNILIENIAEVDKKIPKLYGTNRVEANKVYAVLHEELKGLNFSGWPTEKREADSLSQLWGAIDEDHLVYKQRLEKEAAEKKKEEFDF